LFAVFSLIHFSHFCFNFQLKAMFTKPKTYRRVKELQLWDVGLLVIFAIFVVLLLWCRWNEKAGQTQTKICILFSRHDTFLLIYGIQATWGCCNMVSPYHIVCFISYCFNFHVSYSNCHSSIFAFALYYKSIIMCYNQMFWY
jgi:hypothetical protein